MTTYAGPAAPPELEPLELPARPLPRPPDAGRLWSRAIVLSLLAFLLIDVGAYLISQSFTSPNVILNVSFAQLTMGIVGG